MTKNWLGLFQIKGRISTDIMLCIDHAYQPHLCLYHVLSAQLQLHSDSGKVVYELYDRYCYIQYSSHVSTINLFILGPME